MGAFGRGAFDEAGYPYFALGIDELTEAGVREVPPSHFPIDSKFGRARFRTSFPFSSIDMFSCVASLVEPRANCI